AGEQRRRHVKTERPGGLQIDHQFVSRGCLYWKVSGFLALEDAVNVARRSPEFVDDIRTIRDQTALCDINSVRIDRRPLIASRPVHDQWAVNFRLGGCRHDDPLVRLCVPKIGFGWTRGRDSGTLPLYDRSSATDS